MAFIGTPLDTRNTFQSLVGKRFNGDGSETEFTLDVAPSSTLDIEVFVGNVRQDPNSAYTLSGTTLTFTGAPPSGTNNIYVVHQAKSVGTINAPANSVTSDQLNTALLTGATDIGAGIADADLFLVDDGAGGTLRKTAASRIKTYAGFTASTITGTTALAEQPAGTDEIIISDGGTLKRLDFNHIFNTPAFDAYMNGAQSVSDNAVTKVAIDTEIFDSDGKYDHSTNYRFTPGVAGKYYVYGSILGQTAASQLKNIVVLIYKNGSVYRTSNHDPRNNYGNEASVMVSAIIDMDADDYVELYGQCNANNDANTVFAVTHTRPCYFGAFKILGA